MSSKIALPSRPETRRRRGRSMGERHIYRALGGGRRAHREREAGRLRRIRFRDRENWPREMWLLVMAMIILLFLAPKLAELHWELHHPKAHQR